MPPTLRCMPQHASRSCWGYALGPCHAFDLWCTIPKHRAKCEVLKAGLLSIAETCY